ncbi:mechanosensitive ion channel family protein [Natrinema limicola]|uniref:MscS Mechanosensitive ion channel n=1 Tax=Natrinema limicola JCM 13563 TaxID=1230457 RepID=M0CF87_9EURY|nr:mechanosensitive ion channel family protein [Natrinema limicola]ELZ21323.1 MscS Mechanosensitive ion channel [Natrinema limicola JCM 13563]
MAGLLTGLDWLSGAVPTTELKLVVSLLAAGLVLAVLLSYRRLHERLTERTKPLYADIVSMVLLAGTCLLSLAVVVGVWDQTAAVQRQYTNLELGEDILVKAVFSFILLVGTVILTRFVRRVLREILGSAAAVTDHQREITHRITQVIIWSVSLVVVLGIWVEDLGSLLVGAGFLGIVIGMAARQTLGTVLAGFVLMFARPFEIGDWIEVEDNEGIVTDISIVNTRIRSFDGEYIMIPNDVISTSMVTNRSRRGRLRIEVEVGVDYEADVERAADLAEAAIDEVDDVLAAPSPQVVGKSFGDSAVVLGVRFWIDKPSARRYWNARTAAINAIKDAFEAEGIKIPYPQRELTGRTEAGGFRVADERETVPAEEPSDHRMTTTPEER